MLKVILKYSKVSNLWYLSGYDTQDHYNYCWCDYKSKPTKRQVRQFKASMYEFMK